MPKISNLSTIPVSTVSHDPLTKRVLLKSGDVPHVPQLAQAIIKPGQVSSRHKHTDMTETFYFERGTAEFEIEADGQKVVHEVEAGSCVTVYPGEWHEIRNRGEEDVVVLYFGVVD